MCTIAILVGIADSPVIVAANRDELYARDTRPPQVLAPGVVGGLDAQSGGTWLAIHRAGRFAAVTNQRALDHISAPPFGAAAHLGRAEVFEQAPPGVRSRGLAVVELAASSDQDGYVAALDPRAYASMNLVWGDASRVSIGYLRRDGTKEVAVLSRGVHVLCNDRIGAAGFPRGERLRVAIESALGDSIAWPALSARLAASLGDHTRVPLEEVPPSHLPAELARELTATCIHSDIYGTRSATLLALGVGRVDAYDHADGPPCTTPFRSRLELLA
jgi:uncharacterized protein with NRDE domain